jgi:hypothetical protein
MLSLGRVLCDAYGATLLRIGDFLNQSWAWAFGSYGASMFLALGTIGGPPSVGPVGALVATLIHMAFVSTFMVAWHRFDLLGERAQFRTAFAIDRRVLRFLAVMLVTTVLTAVVLVGGLLLWGDAIANLGDEEIASAASWISPAIGLATALGVYVIGRLALAFPMMAVAEARGAMRRSWRITRPFHLSMVVVVIAPLPVLLCQTQAVPHLLAWVLGPRPILLLVLLVGFVQNWLSFLVVAVGVSALSSAWRQIGGLPGSRLNLIA